MPKGGGSGIIRIFIKGTPGYNKMQKNIVWTLVQGIVKIWGLATGLSYLFYFLVIAIVRPAHYL